MTATAVSTEADDGEDADVDVGGESTERIERVLFGS